MSIPILSTKLYIPQPRSRLVCRPRLIKRLSEGLSRRLTLVCAPAGFGKTTLLAEWIHSGVESTKYEVGSKNHAEDAESPTSRSASLLPTPDTTAWLSLDEADSDPIRFLTYFVAALQGVDPSIGQTAQGLLVSPQPAPVDQVMTPLVADNWQQNFEASVEGLIKHAQTSS